MTKALQGWGFRVTTKSNDYQIDIVHPGKDMATICGHMVYTFAYSPSTGNWYDLELLIQVEPFLAPELLEVAVPISKVVQKWIAKRKDNGKAEQPEELIAILKKIGLKEMDYRPWAPFDGWMEVEK